MQNRISFIEQLRGIALLLVLAYHYTDRIPYKFLGSDAPTALSFYTGKVGVYLFFIISGYLIAKTLENSNNLAEFYAKRISRIWPLFFVANILIFLYVHLFITPVVPEGLKDFDVRNRTFLDLVGTSFFLEDLGFKWIDGVFWSILVEIKYYFYVGLFAVVFRNNLTKYFVLYSIAFGITDLFFTTFMNGEEYRLLNKLLHGVFIAQYLPFFAIGMAMYKKLYDLPFFICCLLGISQLLIVASYNTDFDMNMTLKFATAFCIFICIDHYIFKGKIIHTVGYYSYSLYLFHQVIGLSLIMYLIPLLGINMAVIFAFIIVFILSAVASWLVEWRYRKFFTELMIKVFSHFRIHKLEINVQVHSPPIHTSKHFALR